MTEDTNSKQKRFTSQLLVMYSEILLDTTYRLSEGPNIFEFNTSTLLEKALPSHLTFK